MPKRLPEQLAWDTFKKHTDFNEWLKFWRVENLHGDGMSDVYGRNRNGRDFWLEFKAMEKWPARASTCPLKDKFEPGQIPFLKTQFSWGGCGFVILRVREWDEWFMIHPRDGIDLREMTRKDIEDRALALGLKNIIQALTDLER